MTRFVSVRMAAALALAGTLSAGAAEAAMMHTVALRLGTNAGFACLFTNTSNREVHVTVRLIKTDGAVATASAAYLAPGETHEHNWADPPYATLQCQFEFTGSSKYARATACLSSLTAGCFAVSPAY